MSPRIVLRSALSAALTLGAPLAGQATASTPGPCGHPAVRIVAVRTSAQLKAALSTSHPGDRIVLASGRYAGRFTLSRSGTAARRIAVCGPDATLDGGSFKTGYGFHLTGQYVDLVGFTVTRSQKGVMLDGAAHSVLQRLHVSQIGDEGIHLRADSLDVQVLSSTVDHTGLRVRSYGEGVYVGTAMRRSCALTRCSPDRSDGAVIKGNTFRALGAEAVDAKEGTTNGLVSGNRFDGTGSGAYAWVDVKGNGWVVRDNAGVASRRDGFSVSATLKGWGVGNTFRHNTADVRGKGYGIRVPAGNKVRCDNEVLRAASGYANVACSS